MLGILLVLASTKVSAQTETVSLEELYLHCPESTVVVFKEIRDSFGMRLKSKDCDLHLLRTANSKEDELKNESPARVRRIKRRQTRIAHLSQ